MRPLTLISLAALLSAPAAAQQPVTLRAAVDAALARGTRLRVAEADAAVARAEVLSARAVPNPTTNLTYSKSAPQYHATVDQPLEYPWLRSARIGAAQAGSAAAAYRLQAERAAVVFQVDSAYVRAAAAAELARLSARDAADGAELVRIAQTREHAGDASELDVELARVTQGGLVNQALADSLEAVAAVLDLQSLMGIPAVHPTIVLADSLGNLALPAPGAAAGTPLRVAAAEADVRAREAALRQERASRWASPSLMGGVEWHDPSGSEKGALPTVGVSVPVPLWDRNRGPIAVARASLARAQASLDAARRDAAAALAAAERDREAARVRAERNRELLAHAQRVVAMSTRGYREGAFPLTTVLEAQRSARDAFRQYVQALAVLRTAESAAALAATVGGAP
jgi:cobalt-zinc-cadmium efflux system outer membrane protein